MEDKRIKAVKKWPELQSVWDIQVFLKFANFYRQFIQGFSQIATPLASMLKISGSTESSTQPGKGGARVDGDSKAGRDWNEVDCGEGRDNEVRKKVQKSSKSRNLSKSKKTVGSDFLTPGAKLAFFKLRQVFVKALILYHFDLERHIWIKMDASSYAIGGVLSQLTLDELGWWHPVAFFFCKMIPAETRYETHDRKLLAIVEAFKTWKHYLEGSLCLPIITTSAGSWIQRVWAADKSAGPKKFLVTTSKLTIVRAKLMELLTPCLHTFSKVQRKKRPSELRTSKSCPACSLCWPTLAF